MPFTKTAKDHEGAIAEAIGTELTYLAELAHPSRDKPAILVDNKQVTLPILNLVANLSDLLFDGNLPNTDSFLGSLGKVIAFNWYTGQGDLNITNVSVSKGSCYAYDFDCCFQTIQSDGSFAKTRMKDVNYEVIDLDKQVSADAIIRAAITTLKNSASIIGESAKFDELFDERIFNSIKKGFNKQIEKISTIEPEELTKIIEKHIPEEKRNLYSDYLNNKADQSKILAEESNIGKRLEKAVDVSGAFDNCFFHTYTTHLIANSMPLPEDLFTFKSIGGDESYASKLQKRFPSEDSLSLFENYVQEGKKPSQNYIVEKTLVLGVLMREWFATKMNENLEIRASMQEEIVDKFKNYKDFREAVNKNDLLSGPEGVLYTANEKFLEYFTSRPKGGILTQEEQHFEDYFNSNESENEALINYWNKEGYSFYCHLIGNPSTKLAHTDVMPLLNFMEQTISIYSSNGSVIAKNEFMNDRPKLEVKLNPQEGHYHLLKTDKTAALLTEYESSYNQYKEDRKSVLEARGDKDSVANNVNSLLVGAICPSGHLKKGPFTLLIEKIDSILDFINKKNSAEESTKDITEDVTIGEINQVPVFEQYKNDTDTVLMQSIAAISAVENGEPVSTPSLVGRLVNSITSMIRGIHEAVSNFFDNIATKIGIKA